MLVVVVMRCGGAVILARPVFEYLSLRGQCKLSDLLC